MDIIEFALKMEQDGKAFYEKAAAETTDPQLKEILLSLAEEEKNHYEFFRRLKVNPLDLSGGDILKGNETLKNVKNIFETMAANTDKKPFDDDVVAVWTQALRTEEKAVQLYSEQADKETDAVRKDLLLKIAAEEKNHVSMIDGVLMYVKQPAAFAESAQYRNFRSLEGR